MATARVRRGRKTQAIVAARLQDLFPGCEPVPASLPGRDILGTPGVAIEVKARRDLVLPGWLRQAAKNAGTDLPVLIHRPDGFGEQSVGDWPVTMRLADWEKLMERGGS